MQRTKVLVIDDREDHGICITKQLWKKQIPTLFIHYDEPLLEELEAPLLKSIHTGVRAIILDVNLTNSGSANISDYAIALKLIQRLLNHNNGPWLLITWTTFEEKSTELFNFLTERLPASQRPFNVKSIDKTHYTEDSEKINPLSEESSNEISQLLQSHLESSPPFNFLIEWERSVSSSSSEIIKNLGEVASEHEDHPVNFDERLSHILMEIAVAEAGKSLDQESISPPVYSVLNTLISDRISHSAPSPFSFINSSSSSNTTIDNNWKAKINSMLHLDHDLKNTGSISPGSIYSYPKSLIWPLPIPYMSNSNWGKFIIENFISTTKKKSITPDKASKTFELVMMDITPPCDHAQNKCVWKNFIIGLQINDDNRHFLYQEDETKIKQKLKSGRDLRLNGDQFIITPVFEIKNNNSQFVFSTKVITSSPNIKEINILLKEPVVRIRSQLLNDFIHKIGNQLTRPGITELK
ncbi:hypothetical protein [Amphritea pacifica]|uniref:hypothetical protein n=1 Tax=Amphritea pacifica TaxID=2811233 RepID=UPI0019648B32|nr:hypothetical protein [Amphritea pacifica]MBN1007006.1 hypothetical protein [Amphritea pacifica]